MPRLAPVASPVTIELDGSPLPACEGEPAAAAVVATGELLFSRSPKYHRPRGPFCMTGECAQCLMRVDGVPNVPTCRVPVRAGLRLERQNAFLDERVDLLRANDFVFRDWFNHHEFLAGVPLADQVLLRIARQLSGLGKLPERVPAPRPPAVTEHVAIAVVGLGVAGLAAATKLSALGAAVTVFERDEAKAQLPGVQVRSRADVVGLFADDGPPFLAVIEAGQLRLVTFEHLLLAVGAHATLPTFPNNDLPGVMSGRAVTTFLRHGVLPGERVACCGEPAEANALAAMVSLAGATPLAVGEEAQRAHGLGRVTAVTTASGKHKCDVIAVCGVTTPAFELARAAGCSVVWSAESRSFVVQCDDRGRTASATTFVAGEVRGPVSPDQAAAQGVRAAEALWEARR